VLKVPKLLAIIRIKGTVKVPQEIAETLERLNLKKRNSMVIYYDDPSIIGMIKKAERYVAWGEVNDLEILVQTLKKRGRIVGNHKITQEALQKLGVNSIEELAQLIMNGELNQLIKKGLLRIFRLTPPSGGFKGDHKKKRAEGGVWGYYGASIKDLIKRMI